MYRGWLTSQNRKRHQRVINAVVRWMNKDIHDDPMWKARFYVRQFDARWVRDPDDRQYYRLYVRLRAYDRKTGKTLDMPWWSANDLAYFWGYKLWREMNDFILNSGVWEEEPRITYDNTPDYRSCK